MQTFLPHANFTESAKCLDMKRLGKQRVEVLQLLNSLTGKTLGGWKNHPAREMWRGHEQALVVYGLAICSEWISRGYKDTCYDKINAFNTNAPSPTMPSWLGREDIHLSHKSRLIQKYPEHYRPLWPDAPDNLEYTWPVPLKQDSAK
jgi:hypothetical protein